MAQVVVRHLDVNIKAAIKRRALEHGWSMEEEIRQILRIAVSEQRSATGNLGSRIAARFAQDGLSAPIPEWQGSPAEPMLFDDDDGSGGGAHQ
ncbi:FitA-like ribbon-helix-helix domain-containing protein [Spiribacter insolitus]|uniref:Toxin-antitoxin system n=1 Tax=Spiribacter insolitus TaxID=3122417 RepID=A0ABV3T753_9GAMM